MITKQIIDTIYRKYNKPPKSPDCLDMSQIFEIVADLHQINIDLDANAMLIGSIDPLSPFHRLPLNRIHAIVPFEEWVAIVLHSSIIFLNKLSPKTSIHIKPHTPGLLDKIKSRLGMDEK